MDFNTIQTDLSGKWTGKNLLRLSWLPSPDHMSLSDLTVSRAAKGKFLMFTYSWHHEEIPQEGVIIVGYDEKQNLATAAWIDSWHMSDKVMLCRGTINEKGIIDTRGSYEAPPGPDWGWRIIITPHSSNELKIIMYNCSPEGVEELAVKAEYKRI
jgi:hypothetical protein